MAGEGEREGMRPNPCSILPTSRRSPYASTVSSWAASSAGKCVPPIAGGGGGGGGGGERVVVVGKGEEWMAGL
jgi:hypothetical protein